MIRHLDLRGFLAFETFAPVPAPDTPTPTGIRIASTLCWIVGVLTIGVAVAVYLPVAVHSMDRVIAFVVMLIAGLAVCGAGYLVRQRRKAGAYLVVAAWALPLLWALAVGATPRGNFLLLVAMLSLLPNWKYLR